MPTSSRPRSPGLRALLRAFALLALGLHAAQAAEIRVLSAGAVEPGLRPALAAFERDSGHTVRLSFASAPQIRERVSAGPGAGGGFDLVIAPPAVLDALVAAAKIDADASKRVPIGRVGIGVAVRPGAPIPDVSNTEALKRALLDADSVVFNRASTGLYFETLVQRLGVDAQIAAKTTRPPDGAAVMEHLLRGSGREIGFGAITEILLFRDKGLQFVGPLPAEAQNYTAYWAAPATVSSEPGAVDALLKSLAGTAAQARFVAAGIAAVN